MKQITVVVDDHPGALAEITRALAVAGINIETLSGELVESSGVITVAVDRYDEALVALRDAGFSAVSEDALVVRLDDSPGALARIAHLLAEAGVNIKSMRILRREAGTSLVTLATSDNQHARSLLSEATIEADVVGPTSI